MNSCNFVYNGWLQFLNSIDQIGMIRLQKTRSFKSPHRKKAGTLGLGDQAGHPKQLPQNERWQLRHFGGRLDQPTRVPDFFLWGILKETVCSRDDYSRACCSYWWGSTLLGRRIEMTVLWLASAVCKAEVEVEGWVRSSHFCLKLLSGYTPSSAVFVVTYYCTCKVTW